MIPSCPHCQKNIPISSLLINAKNLKVCPSCQKEIIPKLNWLKGLGFGFISLIVITSVLFFIFGTSQIPSTIGAIAGLAAFMIFGYQFDKKE